MGRAGTWWQRRSGVVLLGAATLWVLLFSLPGRRFGPEAWFSDRHLPATMRHAVERKPMPTVVFERLEGGRWSMADQRGKVVLISLWATWCGPCRAEMPDLDRLAAEFGPGGLEVVGVAMDGVGGPANQEKVRRFAKLTGVRYPILLPPAMSQMEAGLDGLPTTILVDRSGRVAETYVGALEEPGFRREVESLLKEQDGGEG